MVGAVSAQKLCVLEVVSGRPRAARKMDLLLAQFGLDRIARQIAAGTPQIDLKGERILPSRSYEEVDSGQRSCRVKSLNADSGGKHASCSPRC
jgi:hypothetical protein